MLDHIRDLLQPPLRGSRIVYLHVPKCGGTSVRTALDGCFKPWRSTQRNRVLHLDEPAARQATSEGRVQYDEARRTLLAYHLATTDADLVHGHYRYSRAVFERHRGTWSFITMLRDPIDRWYSHFYFNLAHDEGNEYHLTSTLEEHIQTDRAAMQGTELVRAFADVDDPFAARTDVAIGRAIDNLREFTIVGALENLTGFARAFERRFSYPLHIPHVNATLQKSRKPRPEVSREIDDQVREFCAPDLQVYRSLFPKLAEERGLLT